MQIFRMGNGLAVCLPAAVIEALHLREGDEIEICAAEERRLQVRRTPGRKVLLERLRQYRGRLSADFKFDRYDAVLLQRDCPIQSEMMENLDKLK